jgi:putative ABC transport system permease protein
LIIFTIAGVSAVALAINNAAGLARENGLSGVKITASISVDRAKQMEKAQAEAEASGSSSATSQGSRRQMMGGALSQVADLSLDEYQKYAELSEVADFYYSGSVGLSAVDDGAQPVTDSSTDSSTSSDAGASSGSGAPGGFGGGAGGGMGGFTSGDFTLKGFSGDSALTEFVDASAKIVEGEVFSFDEADNNCIITQEFASFNDLSVGDTITTTNPNNSAESYKFNIVGIYEKTDTTSTSDFRMSTALDPANAIYVNFSTLKAVEESSSKTSVSVTRTSPRGESVGTTTSTLTPTVSNTYVFGNKSDYDQFTTDVRNLGLSEDYTVASADVQNFEASLVPLNNLSKFAGTFLIVVLLIGAVVLTVFNIFNIRERKYEIGVLTAIGIKKPKVAVQFVVELLIITVVAVCLGAGVGAAASVPVNNHLLESQISTQQSQTESQTQGFGREAAPGGSGGPSGSARGGGGSFGGGAPSASGLPNFGSSEVKYLDKVNASVNLNVLLELMGISLLLAIISSTVSVGFICRYEPLQILADR